MDNSEHLAAAHRMRGFSYPDRVRITWTDSSTPQRGTILSAQQILGRLGFVVFIDGEAATAGYSGTFVPVQNLEHLSADNDPAPVQVTFDGTTLVYEEPTPRQLDPEAWAARDAEMRALLNTAQGGGNTGVLTALASVTDDSLHFGTDPSDPTGVNDCESCGGRGPESATCTSCQDRQELRNAWWNSSGGPARIGQPSPPARRYLDDEEA